MSKAYIEVSQSVTVHNASRASSFMDLYHDFVESDAKVKDAVSLIKEYGVCFSHYVDSVRHGRIAVYKNETDEGNVSIRLKMFSAEKLQKIYLKTS